MAYQASPEQTRIINREMARIARSFPTKAEQQQKLQDSYSEAVANKDWKAAAELLKKARTFGFNLSSK